MTSSKVVLLVVLLVIAVSRVRSKSLFKRRGDQFVLADTNADGYVDYDELSAIVGISKRHIAKVHLGNYDKDGDAKLSLDEFNASPFA
mmetsp:Transcript_63247/g.100413  ORF Transcript_63247/g.100413 Transcript_63247/m.100413 type:complete len:88 (+) Transcript_63247:118-381(+)